MLNGSIDLHLHTTCSDGLDTPEDIVKHALLKGYKAISITDHDTVDGVIRGIKIAQGTPLEVIPGIELSSVDGDDDIHILGYYMDIYDAEFKEKIALFAEKRSERAEEIVRSLNRLGLKINIKTVEKIAHGAPIGRPHIAEALLSESQVSTFNEAFYRYIGTNGPAYVPKFPISSGKAVALIRKSGGIPVLAHPAVSDRDDIIEELIEYGLMGIEAIHPFHSIEKQLYYEQLAAGYGLITTGGSDWHGKARMRTSSRLDNMRPVSENILNQMKLLAKKSRKSSGKKLAKET